MGILIALEGIDGSGKSTQAHQLRDRLEAAGHPVVVFREPGDTEYGDELRRQFREGRAVNPDEEARLFIEDRRIDVRDNILPSLSAGKIVIMDRYYFSTMAHQGALGLDVDELRATNESFAPRPDLTLILDLPVEVSLERIRAARETPNEFEKAEYLEKVRELFLGFCDGDVAAVDATVSSAELGEEIFGRVLEVLGRASL